MQGQPDKIPQADDYSGQDYSDQVAMASDDEVIASR